MTPSETSLTRNDKLLDIAAKWLVPIILLGLAIFCYQILGVKEKVSKQKPNLSNIPVVVTVPVKEHTTTLDINLEGKVVPHQEMVLSAQVSGTIIDKKDICRPGRYVKKDTVLLEIDPQDYDIEFKRAEQDLKQAHNNIDVNKQEIKNTDDLIKLASEDLKLRIKALKRMESLSGRRAISESEMDAEKRTVLVARNSVQTLQNQAALLKAKGITLDQSEKIAETNLKKAKLQLSRTKIKAPVSGVIVSTEIEKDSLVQPGMELLRIEDTSAVEIHTQLQMKELYWIWQQASFQKDRVPSRDYEIPKSPATVSYELEGSIFQWKGRLERFEGIGLDEKTRTVACRIIVENPREVKILRKTGNTENKMTGPPALLRGMYVDISVHVKPKILLLSLPEIAVQPGNKVWMVSDGRLEIIPIQIAEWNKKNAILNGLNTKLKVGDQIITSPIPVFEPGMKVEISKQDVDKKSAT